MLISVSLEWENEGLSLDINLGTFRLDVGELKSSGCGIFSDFPFSATQQTFDNHDIASAGRWVAKEGLIPRPMNARFVLSVRLIRSG